VVPLGGQSAVTIETGDMLVYIRSEESAGAAV